MLSITYKFRMVWFMTIEIKNPIKKIILFGVNEIKRAVWFLQAKYLYLMTALNTNTTI